MRPHEQRILELQILQTRFDVDIEPAKKLILIGDEAEIDSWLDKTNDELAARLHTNLVQQNEEFKRECEERRRSRDNDSPSP